MTPLIHCYPIGFGQLYAETAKDCVMSDEPKHSDNTHVAVFLFLDAPLFRLARLIVK